MALAEGSVMQPSLVPMITNNHAVSTSASPSDAARRESSATPSARQARSWKKRSLFGGNPGRLFFALGVVAAALAFSPSAHAEESRAASADDARPFSLGLRGQFWYTKGNTLAFGEGFDFTYGLNRYVAIGAQQLFYNARCIGGSGRQC